MAIALRNRWRRQQVDEKLRGEITPKNILMIGPTGVGKTEIARRLARLADAPFIKVEATKFTEVGYVGKDVDSIIRDLAEMAVKQTRVAEMRKVRSRAEDAAEERILDVLMPPARTADCSHARRRAASAARQAFRKKLREGQLDDKEIEIDLAEPAPQLEIMGPAGMEEMTEQLRGMFSQFGGGKRKTRKLKIAEAMKLLIDEEAAKLVNEDEIRARGDPRTPSRTASSSSTRSTRWRARAARAAAAPTCRARACSATCCRWWKARPCPPSTARSRPTTSCSSPAAPSICAKPSDLIPELQGRFPIRVELKSLSVQDFEAILTQTHASLVKQYQALLATEGVTLEFAPEGITRLAHIAYEVNERTENIGARRLSTVMERLLDEVSFDATRLEGQDGDHRRRVCGRAGLAELSRDEDLSRYIL